MRIRPCHGRYYRWVETRIDPRRRVSGASLSIENSGDLAGSFGVGPTRPSSLHSLPVRAISGISLVGVLETDAPSPALKARGAFGTYRSSMPDSEVNVIRVRIWLLALTVCISPPRRQCDFRLGGWLT
jgi:hypothetical protein